MKKLLALALLALATVGLPGGSGCDGNLGDVSTGPVSFRVSVATNFAPADGPSTRPTTNFDGSLVAFESRALNLTRTEPSFKEILLRDRNTLTVTSASRLFFETNKAGLADCEDPAMSADGEWVIFHSRRDLGDDAANPGPETFSTLWRYNRSNNDVSLIVPTLPFTVPMTPVDGDCGQASVSANGMVIAFTSVATNIETTPPYTMDLTPVPQIFVVDLNAGQTRLISHSVGAPGTACNMAATDPVVSADGQWIVFKSRATDLVAPAPATSHRRVYRASLDGSVIELVSRLDGAAGTPSDNHCGSASVNADGSLIAFAFQGGNLAPAPGSGDLGFPLIVRDFNAVGGPVNRVIAQDCFMFGLFPSVNNPFADDTSAMSADGASVVYVGGTPGLTDLAIKVAETNGGGTRLLSKGVIQEGITTIEELFSLPTMSGDGRWAFWRADYSQEVIGDTNALGDVFGYGPLR